MKTIFLLLGQSRFPFSSLRKLSAVSCIINYTKKSLKSHDLSDFSFRGVFLQPLLHCITGTACDCHLPPSEHMNVFFLLTLIASCIYLFNPVFRYSSRILSPHSSYISEKGILVFTTLSTLASLSRRETIPSSCIYSPLQK